MIGLCAFFQQLRIKIIRLFYVKRETNNGGYFDVIFLQDLIKAIVLYILRSCLNNLRKNWITLLEDINYGMVPIKLVSAEFCPS